MSCARVQEALSAQLDQEATAAERIVIDAHLGTCARCRAAWSTLQVLRASADRLPRDTAPASLRARIHALSRSGEAVRTVDSAPGRLLRILSAPVMRPVAVTAIAVLLLGVGTANIVRTKVVQPRVKLARQLVLDHEAHLAGQTYDASTQNADQLTAYFNEREPVAALIQSLPDEHLVGGSVCDVCAQRAAHVAFEDAGHHTVSVYVLRAADQPTGWGKRTVFEGGAYQVASVQGSSVVTWVGGRARYAVVSPEPQDDALALASHIRGAFAD
jgi:anti-sigma factor RsiW